MPLQDRTNEFLACVESIRSRSSLPPKNPGKQRLLDKQARADSKSDFTRMASTIGKDISSTTVKLGKLAQLAKRKTLFDDRPVEISELTFVIKQDMRVSTSKLRRSRQMSNNVKPRVVPRRLRRSRLRSITIMWSCSCKISLRIRA